MQCTLDGDMRVVRAAIASSYCGPQLRIKISHHQVRFISSGIIGMVLTAV